MWNEQLFQTSGTIPDMTNWLRTRDLSTHKTPCNAIFTILTSNCLIFKLESLKCSDCPPILFGHHKEYINRKKCFGLYGLVSRSLSLSHALSFFRILSILSASQGVEAGLHCPCSPPIYRGAFCPCSTASDMSVTGHAHCNCLKKAIFAFLDLCLSIHMSICPSICPSVCPLRLFKKR